MHWAARIRSAVAISLALATGCGGAVQLPAASHGAVPASIAMPASIAVRGSALSPLLLPPAGTIFVGAFVNPNGGVQTPSEQIAATSSFETAIGRKLAIDMHYKLWTDTLVGIAETDDATNGRIPLVSWSCIYGTTHGVKDADVAAGLYDAAISQRAAAVAAYGRPIFLRYKWEMNLLYNEGCADPAHDIVDLGNGKTHYSPKEYIAAWQHIRALFLARGATNVVWLWNPSGEGIAPSQYYPGDSQVDWVGLDFYDSFNLFFSNLFTLTSEPKSRQPVWTYGYLASNYPDKPLIIGETGAVQIWQSQFFMGDANDPSADQSLQNVFPLVRAFMYWDSTGSQGDYKLLAAGQALYAQFASGPYESAMYSPPPTRLRAP